MDKRVAFYTLGCKLNYSESSTLAREFIQNGYTVVSSDRNAEIYVINTCSVTEHAEKKCRNIIRRIHRQSPDSKIIVTGCYAQLSSDFIASLDGVEIVVGSEWKSKLFNLAKESENNKILSSSLKDIVSVFPAYSSGERTRSFLKVQDGCDYFCTYCTVPYARGRSRNISIDQIVLQAGDIAREGIKEVVLTGVNTGDFGKSTGESFLELLKSLVTVDGIERYRISSIEPNLLSEDILRWISKERKIMPHFHIPLQSGSDTVLMRMKRRYNSSDFKNKIESVREFYNNPFIGLDIIVGFPGESEEEFNQTYDLLSKIKPSFLHVFPYSKRPGTPAAEMSGQIPEEVKKSRVEKLTNLSDQLHVEYIRNYKGKEDEVLFEGYEKRGMMFGYSRNYIKVEKPYDPELIGKIIKTTI